MADEVERDSYVHPGKRLSKSGYEMGHGQGMALRDYFAGQVITRSFTANLSADELADQAYEIADAMMARRNQE